MNKFLNWALTILCFFALLYLPLFFMGGLPHLPSGDLFLVWECSIIARIAVILAGLLSNITIILVILNFAGNDPWGKNFHKAHWFLKILILVAIIAFYLAPWKHCAEDKKDIDATEAEVKSSSDTIKTEIKDPSFDQQFDQSLSNEPDSFDIIHQARMDREKKRRDSLLKENARKTRLFKVDSLNSIKKKKQDAEFCSSDKESDSLIVANRLIDKKWKKFKLILQTPCECPPPKSEERLINSLRLKEKKN